MKINDINCMYYNFYKKIGCLINFLENIQIDYNKKKKIFDYKTITKIWLKNNDLPYVKEINYDNIDINEKIVIKPINDKCGNGIYIDKRKNLPKKLPENYMAEEFVYGNNYRIIVYKGRIISIILRTGAHITGDGINTIEKLINIENENRCNDTKLYCDLKCKKFLKTILKKNQIYYVNPVSNYAKGGTIKSIDIKKINNEIKEICNKIYKLLNVNIFGVDFICENIEKNFNNQTYAINELEFYNDVGLHVILKDDTYKLYNILILKWILIILIIILIFYYFIIKCVRKY